MQVIPDFLYDFIKLFVNQLKPKNILDPWLTRDSYPIIKNFDNFRGITINQAEYNLITTGLLKDSNKIKLGDGLENIDKEQNEFDFIVSYTPFVMPSRKHNSTSKDYSTDLLIESSNRLAENGKLFFLMPQKFLHNKRIKQAISDSNISIDGIFYLEEGSHYPITSISTYLVVASLGECKSTFTAKLTSDKKSNEIIYKNFITKKEGVKIQLGKFIELENFNSFKALEKEDNLFKLGKRTGLPMIHLNDISIKINTIRDIKQENVEHKPNSIYVPKVGNIDVVHNPSDFNIKPKNYLQIVLNDNASLII